MDRRVNHEEIKGALGAYALDAVEPSEAESIRRHLDECPGCAAEVAEHHRTAALLGTTAGGEAPTHLWGAIAGRLGDRPDDEQRGGFVR